jgi:hypothetical protein
MAIRLTNKTVALPASGEREQKGARPLNLAPMGTSPATTRERWQVVFNMTGNRCWGCGPRGVRTYLDEGGLVAQRRVWALSGIIPIPACR